MNTPMITMSPEAAKAKLYAYKKTIGQLEGRRAAESVSREYEAVAKGYAALAKGTPLIDLQLCMSACGFDEKGRPKLAICRADQFAVKFCWTRQDSPSIEFRPQQGRRRGPLAKADVVLVLDSRPSSATRATGSGYQRFHDGYARTPMIPADVRPAGQERDWFVLWEVEKWADERREIMPDKDPYLLKHLGGMLYAVIAEWNLTELERAVMRQVAT